MTQVSIQNNESIDKMYKIFRKQTAKSGLFGEIKRKDFQENSTISRRKKHQEALKRLERILKEGLDY